MATLLEMWTIESNAQSGFETGEPTEVTQARDLFHKFHYGALKNARLILDDETEIPPTEPDRTERLELIAWAQQAGRNPAGAALELLRFGISQAAALTVPQILTRTDAQIESGITAIIPILAKGMNVGR